MMRNRLLILLILLVTAVLRFHNLTTLGLEHDEVANWLIDRSILDENNYAVYYTAAYGHEAGFHYLQAATVGLIGDNALALRLPASLSGILLVAVSYALARKLFGKDEALFSAGLLAVLFWPIFYSRLGLRAIMLPVMSGLSAYFWWQAWEGKGGRQRAEGRITRSPLHLFTLSGLFAGLSLYTYMAARAVPIFYGLYIGYLALFHRTELKKRWPGVLLFVVMMTAVSLPLVIYLQTNPVAEFRISEIDAPLQALKSGNLRPMLENSFKILGMFGWRGDPLWRQNVAGQPVFEPIFAILFYLGLGVSVWRWHDGRYAFLLLWLLASAAPSIVTVDAPSSIRIINLLPVLPLFLIAVIHILGQLSTVFPKLSTERSKIRGKLLLTILLVFYLGRTANWLYRVWPQNEEVKFVWQAALTETGTYLNNSPNTSPVAIGGWSPDTMDPPTMQLALQRDDLDLRYFGSDSMTASINTLILPGGADTIRITRPNIRTFVPALENQLVAWGAAVETRSEFTIYHLPFTFPAPQYPMDANFGGELQLLGTNSAFCLLPSDFCLVSFWQVLNPPTAPRRFFAHLLDGAGNIVSQHDSLDAPASHWQPGDILVQFHELAAGDSQPAQIRLGVYDPDSCASGPCQNLLVDGERPFLMLPVE
ncbi:MAG: glycosyltransferase family 39 protein [Ardenticatenaceae bacterium]|nr:glycosyltransferase family 39 protein [Ardenticatenaceae bacterium]MCB9446308.1 glycosyltransferase family 39 protein [Ardenticatenaceae bacterium]